MTTHMKPYPGFRVLSDEELEASLDWDTGLSDDGAPSLAEVAAGSTRHLPGKHDQASHGRKGGGGGRGVEGDDLPAGFTVLSDTPHEYYVTGGRMGLGVVIQCSDVDNPGLAGVKDDAQRSALMHRMVNRAAQVVGPLDRQYETSFKTIVAIESPGYVRGLVGSTWKNIPGGVTIGQRIVLNQNIFFTPKTGPGAWKGKDFGAEEGSFLTFDVSGPGAAKGVSYEAYLYGSSGSKHNPSSPWVAETAYHANAYRVDPVRAIITHEYGHVVDERAGSNKIYDKDQHEYVEGTHPTGTRIWGLSKEDYATLPEYARESSVELYAESFAEWHMRDVAEPSRGAIALAHLAHWKDAAEVTG